MGFFVLFLFAQSCHILIFSQIYQMLSLHNFKCQANSIYLCAFLMFQLESKSIPKAEEIQMSKRTRFVVCRVHLHHKCTVLSMFVTEFIKLHFDKQDWDKVFIKEGIEIAVSVHSTELFNFVGWQWNAVKYTWDAANKSVKTFRWNTT